MYEYKCEIVRVVDGDTVDVNIDLGFGIWMRNERVRLYGIDTPESRTRDKTEKVFGKLAAQARQHIAENYDYVGDGFAEEARSMYYGERDHRPIWGETTADERESLKEEGVPAAPLPPAFVPPKSSDKTKLN